MKIEFLFSKTYDLLISQDDTSVGKIFKSLELLEKYGSKAHYPHTKHITDGIFELRVLGSKNIRMFFVFRNNEALVLHAIIKKTNKIPKRELDKIIAIKRELQ